jgi:hypothetical protein
MTRHRLGVRPGLIVVLAALVLGGVAPLIAPATPAGAVSTYTIGQQPLNDVINWAGQQAACGLTTNQLAAMMIAPGYPETGASGLAAPSPMTLSRYDTGSGLYAFGNPSTPYQKAFWHPGVGEWAFDSAGFWNLSGADAINTDTAAHQAATTMAARWCNSSGTDAQRRQSVWSIWYGCTSGVCETIYNAVFDPTALKINVDPSVGRLGGAVAHTCRTPDGTFSCLYVDPSQAQGYRGWLSPAFGPSPVSAPFYVITVNGREQRWWLRQDTGYDSTIEASKVVTANARTSLTWNKVGDLCDTDTGRGTCDWTGWQSIGGAFVGAPTVATNLDGRLEVFATDGSGVASHKWQLSPNGPWSGWQVIGGVAGLGGLVASRNADGHLEAFGTTPDHLVWHSWVGTGGIWSPWVTLDGAINGSLTVSPNSDGRLELYGVDPSGTVQHRWQVIPNGGWAPQWYAMPGPSVTSVDVGRNLDRRLEIVARTANGSMSYAFQIAPDGFWSGWFPLGGSAAGQIKVATNADGRLEVFARGSSGDLIHSYQLAPNGFWSGVVSLGSQLQTDPLVARNADGRLEVFADAASGQVLHSWQLAPNSGWSGWMPFSGVAPQGLAVTNNANGRIYLFGIAADGVLYANLQL